MIFKDKVEIFVKSGDGGDGAVSFRREKFIPNGGPDGGDGGNGGDIIFCVNNNLNNLSKFHNREKFLASRGENGDTNKCFGKQGSSLKIEVPLGTLIFALSEDMSQEILFDMSEKNALFAIHGGRGGKGNIHFKSAVRQSPQYAQKGTPGVEKKIILELKSIANIGLVGFPNAGKSSLISRLTKSQAKIGAYPFTTLSPNLGMMTPDYFGDGLVIADIPGLIPDASEGKGLGLEFLRHIERTQLLLFVLDINDSPEEKFHILRKELASYSEKLTNRPFLVCLNKIDLISDECNIQSTLKALKSQSIPIFYTSAITHEGITILKQALFEIWNNLPEEESNDELEPHLDPFEDFTKGLNL